MSTQTPTPPTPKGPRNNRRNQKKISTPAQKAAILSTPPSSPPRAVSPRGATTDSSNNVTLSKKKGVRSNKKPRDVSITGTSPGTQVNKTGHRHTSSHPSNNLATPQLKDSPHYAGPTFHASPAPSALPIPSFFSKSMPESDPAPALDPDSDGFDADPDIEGTPSKPRSRSSQAISEEQQSTPLDFLFKAAVEARKSQPKSQRSPEPASRVQSPQTDSKAFQQRRINNGVGGMFPLEMDGPESRHSQIGPSFAPSYKDRMNALRSTSSPSPPTVELDEDQRKAKTEALKNLLLNPRPQRPASGSHSTNKQVGELADQYSSSSQVPHFATPARTISGPPTVFSQNRARERTPQNSKNEYLPDFPPPSSHSPQQFQSSNSTLRREILSASPGNAPGTSREAVHSPPPAYDYSKNFLNNHTNHTYNSTYYPPAQVKSPVSRNTANVNVKASDTKKMEDDLRRILKLDINPGIPSSGIQSSFA